MFYFVKMSSGWYGKKISDIASYEEDIQELVDVGDIVILCDDKESLTEMGIDVDDIKMVEDE